ncbi:hypothetical protein C7M84_004142 [Penaeus vannamei]|uniref:Uncharacterized protein n=1 Tax=Penaeus vannamei TaxID=6689 RepID=A0A423TLA3_PENVA|nr:hypothetical protein C7M84_004142 [Penaeus vannamei]
MRKSSTPAKPRQRPGIVAEGIVLQGTRTSSSSVYVRGVTCLGAAKSAASAAKSSALLVVRGWVQCIHSPTHKQACELYMPACALVCQGRSTFPSVLSFLAPKVRSIILFIFFPLVSSSPLFLSIFFPFALLPSSFSSLSPPSSFPPSIFLSFPFSTPPINLSFHLSLFLPSITIPSCLTHFPLHSPLPILHPSPLHSPPPSLSLIPLPLSPIPLPPHLSPHPFSPFTPSLPLPHPPTPLPHPTPPPPLSPSLFSIHPPLPPSPSSPYASPPSHSPYLSPHPFSPFTPSLPPSPSSPYPFTLLSRTTGSPKLRPQINKRDVITAGKTLHGENEEAARRRAGRPMRDMERGRGGEREQTPHFTPHSPRPHSRNEALALAELPQLKAARLPNAKPLNLI